MERGERIKHATPVCGCNLNIHVEQVSLFMHLQLLIHLIISCFTCLMLNIYTHVVVHLHVFHPTNTNSFSDPLSVCSVIFFSTFFLREHRHMEYFLPLFLFPCTSICIHGLPFCLTQVFSCQMLISLVCLFPLHFPRRLCYSEDPLGENKSTMQRRLHHSSLAALGMSNIA